ncbi:MAG: alkaline phosphatase family protein [Pseudomonadota bacterium]|nr:alkaline phosphatase family protein [Pseudomonadota bacterium]
MTHKVVLILVDGLGYETAVHHCGYLEGRVAAGRGRRRRMLAELPSMSRPLYHTIHTGLGPVAHGITSNDTVRTSDVPSVFSLARAAGRTTAAAAYSWFSELYVKAPFDAHADSLRHDTSADIQHGFYYVADSFPDGDLFNAASALLHGFAPDYLLVHPMGCDHLGHAHGGQSAAYRTNATKIDALIARFAPVWEARGHRVLVTADHGMNADGYHGGTKDDVRHVPFYDLGASPPDGDTDVSQLSVAPTVLDLMGLGVPSTMVAPSLA